VDTGQREQAVSQAARAREEQVRRDEADAVRERAAAEGRARDEEVRADQARGNAQALEQVEEDR
jgi:hypothetical protein